MAFLRSAGSGLTGLAQLLVMAAALLQASVNWRVVEGYDVVCETSEASPSLDDSKAVADLLLGMDNEAECCTTCYGSYCNTVATSGTAAASVCGSSCVFPTCFLCRDVGIFTYTIINNCEYSQPYPSQVGGYCDFFGDSRINLFNSADAR